MRADKTQFGAVQDDDPVRPRAYYGRDRRGYDVSLDSRDAEGVPMMGFRTPQGSLIHAVRADESSSWDRERDPSGQAWGAEYWESIHRPSQFRRGAAR